MSQALEELTKRGEYIDYVDKDEDVGSYHIDPYGPNYQPTEFLKNDQGKVMVSLVDPDFILGVGDILTFGARKYAKDNWKLNTDLDRYRDALLRHLYAYLSGELVDPESGKPHLDHVACNTMFLRYFEHGKGANQQPKGN